MNAMKSGFTVLMAAMMLAAVTSAASASSDPVAVSPGGVAQVKQVPTACPTFSWGAVEGAAAYEVQVFELDNSIRGLRKQITGALDSQPVLTQAVSAAATSWTPSLGECLLPGRSYAWSVREIDVEGNEIGAPSQPRIFRIPVSGPGAGVPEPEPETSLRHSPTLPSIPGSGASEPSSSGAPPAPEAVVESAQVQKVTLKSINARLDDIEATLAEIQSQVTPGRINTSSSLCFTLPAAALQIESGFENELGIQPRVGLGINLWGNKAEGNAKMESKGASELKVSGGVGATFQICLEGPGHSFGTATVAGKAGQVRLVSSGPSNPALDPLADAMEQATDIITGEVADHAGDLGFDPQTIAEKTQKAIDIWKGLQLPSDPLELLDPTSAVRMALKDTTDLLPIPQDVKDRMQHPEDYIPDSISEMNICDPAFMFTIPDGKLMDLKEKVCGFGDRVMEAGGFQKPANIDELADDAIDRIEAMVNLKEQILGALDAIIRMEEAISGTATAIEDTFPSAMPPLPNPPSPPRPKGGHPICSMRVPPPGCGS
jgi:hypothetical protein